MTGDTTLLASPHKIQEQFISFYPATNEGYFRRSGNDYFAHFAVSTFTSALDYAPSIYDDVNFLQENLKTGDSWYSKTYTGRTSLGLQTLSLRYQYVCVDADAAVVLSGRSFLHVYKIRMIPEVADPGNPLVATGRFTPTIMPGPWPDLFRIFQRNPDSSRTADPQLDHPLKELLFQFYRGYGRYSRGRRLAIFSLQPQ